MAKTSKTFPIGRDTKTGQFKPIKDVKKSDVVERVPKKGHGDTK